MADWDEHEYDDSWYDEDNDDDDNEDWTDDTWTNVKENYKKDDSEETWEWSASRQIHYDEDWSGSAWPTEPRKVRPQDVCHKCGEKGHWARDCDNSGGENETHFLASHEANFGAGSHPHSVSWPKETSAARRYCD